MKEGNEIFNNFIMCQLHLNLHSEDEVYHIVAFDEYEKYKILCGRSELGLEKSPWRSFVYDDDIHRFYNMLIGIAEEQQRINICGNCVSALYSKES